MKGGKLQIGIIGCGGIANGKHMPALAKAERAMYDGSVLRYCRGTGRKGKIGIRHAGFKGLYGLQKLLEDDSIDVVHVLTPNVLHCPITVDAFAAGKHVMSEKPMASTSADAQKCYRRGKKRQTVHYRLSKPFPSRSPSTSHSM